MSGSISATGEAEEAPATSCPRKDRRQRQAAYRSFHQPCFRHRKAVSLWHKPLSMQSQRRKSPRWEIPCRISGRSQTVQAALAVLAPTDVAVWAIKMDLAQAVVGNVLL